MTEIDTYSHDVPKHARERASVRENKSQSARARARWRDSATGMETQDVGKEGKRRKEGRGVILYGAGRTRQAHILRHYLLTDDEYGGGGAGRWRGLVLGGRRQGS